MASSQIIPTRMELSRIKHKLQIARKGHKLLKDKRDELMRQFMIMVKENMELRKKVEAGIEGANTNFVIAKAGMDEYALNTALMAPKQKVELDMTTKNVTTLNDKLCRENIGCKFFPFSFLNTIVPLPFDL